MDLKTREEALLLQFKNISAEKFYDQLIDLGKTLPPYPKELKIDRHRVIGCQSLLYCIVSVQNGTVQLQIDSDALISKGLAALVYQLYNNLPIQEIITTPLTFFKEINILSSLSMTRLNGLQSLLRHVVKETLSTI